MKQTISKLLAATFLLTSLSLLSCSPSEDQAGATTSSGDHVQPHKWGNIAKVHTVDGIYLSGQPKEADFTAIKEDGIKTVINLRKPDEMTDFDEKKVVEDLGMTYISLPWNGPEELSDYIFDKSRNLLKNAEKPVLLHCASSNRVGAVWLPYRVLDNGLTLEEALDEAKEVGLKSAEYQQKAEEYVSKAGK